MGHPDELPDSPRSRLELMLSYSLTQMIYVVVRLGIPDLLQAGPRTAEELAQIVQAHPAALFRLMRALACLDVFSQDDQDRFALTGISRLLCSNTIDTLQPFARTYGEPWWWETWDGLLYSVQSGETAFEHVHGMSLFDYLAQNPGAASIFNNNMTSMTAREAKAVLQVYDFSHFRQLVDVGGGQGALAIALLEKYLHLSATIFDLPQVIAGAHPRLESAGVADRCRLVGGSFFDSIPAGGDIYLLKDILHDWDDEPAISILKNIRRVMEKKSRLLVIERVIFADKPSAAAKMVDINMLVMSGGKERTAEEYRRLLAAGGFRLGEIFPADLGISIIEAYGDES